MPQEIFIVPGAWHRWDIPAKVDRVHVSVKGAGNGVEAGGVVEGYMDVTPGLWLYIGCGGQGAPHSGRQSGAGGWNGGGWGGTGRGTGVGGDGGGGGSAVCIGGFEGPPGWFRVIAAGAGGRSGDGGHGGEGGAESGERGDPAPGLGGVVRPTGGDQSSPGTGGKNQSAPATFDGENGDNGVLAPGGRGGQAGQGVNSNGGGGGGGGWRSGGGGSASGNGSPGVGGAGGSNYVDGLSDVTKNQRGGGNIVNGSVVITWGTSVITGDPNDPNNPNAGLINTTPPPPSDLKVDGVDLGSDTTTRAMTQVTFTATLSNPNQDESTAMVLRIVAADNDTTTEEWNFGLGYMTFTSDWVGNVSDGSDGKPVAITVTGLQPNQKYYVRAYSLDSTGFLSIGQGEDPTQGGWSGGSFWTNRTPSPPTIISPSDNVSYEVIENIFFSWALVDPDDDDSQSRAQVRVRRLTRPNEGVTTDWVTIADIYGNTTSYTALAADFTGNQFYIWQARTADSNGVWSEWSGANSFFVESGTTPPIIVSPRRGEAVVAAASTIFRWEYVDPIAGSTQVRADLRLRVVGSEEWVIYYGDPAPAQPGAEPEWVFPLNTLIEGYHYEWSVRTVNSALLTSDWSTVEDFWATAKPGDGIGPRLTLPKYDTVAPPLGCGNNRVFVFDRGGEVMRGEITPAVTIRYGRVRDDISTATIITNGFGKDCGALLSELRSWMHEIVIFRDGKRVWEGPITRIESIPGYVEIEAKDVLGYVYRRIMRQGYNDTYREIGGIKRGGMSVVHRATLTVMNALAYDDPNVLRWVTEIAHSDDAVQHRAVPDYAKMAWEEIDDLAANAGLDYTTVGRRIVFWDTHRAIGRLPEMRDGDFSQPVHVTEYGMQLANHFGVTNNNGVYGTAERGMIPGQPPPYYGWVEQLVSAFGEAEGDEETDLTEAARASLEEALTKQADRGIAARWPTPLVVRVPDNATINPDVNLGFDQLVPGVWIPVRAEGTIRKVSQWQKLDAVTVEQTADAGEQIRVTMSPAPNGGNDPDADAAALELG